MIITARQITYVLFLIATTAMSQVSFIWQPRAPYPGGGRWTPMSFSLDGKGYVVGGYDGSASRSDMWMYDPDANHWVQRASMPEARHLAGAFALAGKGYVVCGLNGTSFQSQTMFEYDPVMDSWTSKAPFPGTARYGVFSFAIGGIGYVGSGNTGSGNGPYVSDGYAYNPSTNSWAPMAALPGQSRYGTTSFTTGGKGYVHGGRLASLAFSNDLFAYDPATNAWTPKPAMTGPGRSWAMSMPFAFDAVVACGKDESNVNLYDAYRYVPGLDLWQPIPDFPGNSGWGGASFAFTNRVFGGLGRRILEPNSGYFVDWWELVKVDETSVGELTSSGVQVLPNPVGPGSTHLLISGFDSTPETNYSIVDVSGRVLRTGMVARGGMVSVEDVPAGQYQLVLSSQLTRASASFLILR